ncbi:MAG: hypothetical protein M1828_005943 [Chrysothrix sp. TS-e1954]|nr:MAG: hypothetical protein M1828_005943 [Chrysothrix sp. TS-e1954]
MSVPSTGLDGSAIPGAGGVLDVNTAAFGGIDESWMAGWELDSATSMSSTPASSHADTFEHDRLQYPSNDYDPFRPDIGTDDRHGGSPIMCHNDQFRPSTLHIAVQKGNCRVLRLLLEHGADCDSKDTAGFTPLICATIRGYDDMVCLLLLHGAGIGHVDNSHRSALHWAIICRRERLLQKLLKHCGNDDALINSSTIEGRTALYIAVENGFDEAVELLLEHRAKLD